MAFDDPLWLTASGGVPSYSAREWRRQIHRSWFEGVVRGLKVSQRGAGANMSIDVAVGEAIVDGDDQANQGAYEVACTALENKVVTAAPGSNSRIDLVVLEVRDPTAGGAAGNDTQFRVIAGTPGASPVAPALPPTAIPLAQILIPTGKISIVNADITDVRPLAGRVQPIGTLEMSARGTFSTVSGWAWNGWLVCDGSAVSRTIYAELFDVISTSHGVGDGSTTFNLPDYRGRSPVGRDDMGGTTAAGNDRINTGSFGSVGGTATHTLTEAELAVHDHTLSGHTHTQDHTHAAGALAGPSHTHPALGTITIEVRNAAAGGDFAAYSPDAGAGSPQSGNIAGSTAAAGTGAVTGSTGGPSIANTGGPSTNDSGNAGLGTAHNNTHPYQTCAVLICAGRV